MNKIDSLKELRHKREINRLEGEILTWKLFIVEEKLSGDDLLVYQNAIKRNEEKLNKI